MKPRLLIADDHTLIVEGFRVLLEPEFQLVGRAENGHLLLNIIEQEKPDVVLMDIAMPGMSGIETTRELKKVLPGCHVVIVTMQNEPEFVTAAFRAGASAYVLKSAAASELLLAIRQVLAGRHYVTPLVTKRSDVLHGRQLQNADCQPPDRSSASGSGVSGGGMQPEGDCGAASDQRENRGISQGGLDG